MGLKKLHVLFRRWPHFLAGLSVVMLLWAIAAPFALSSRADAALIEARSVMLSDVTAAAPNVTYNFSFSTQTSGPIGSISFTLCTTYLFNPGDPCTSPDGYDAASAVLASQTGANGFSIDPSTTVNKIVISRPIATSVSPQPLNYVFENITNPEDIGSYYVRIATYASTDGTGPETDYGNVAFATVLDIQITTEVPPYLLFCTGITIEGYNCGTAEGGFINFGELSVATPRMATSQMLASTNAAYGYSVTLAGTTMTAGNNVIPAMTGSSSQTGTSQFGLNARSNSGPAVGSDPEGPGLVMPSGPYNIPNNFRFQSGDIISSTETSDDYRKLTVSYIVNRSPGQPAGKYVATISYIALANF